MSTDSATDQMSPDAGAPADRRSSFRRQMPAVAVLGAIALLLVGVGIGLMIHGGDAPATDRPAADSAAVGFAQDMTTHHAQGVAMAKVALTEATSPEVRALAYDILTQQTNQMGQMQSWLARWDQPVDNPNTAMSWMAGEGHDHGGMSGMSAAQMTAGNGVTTPLMPGMATTSELTKLQSLRGSAVDLDFLALMLRHHRGGLAMMEYAADGAHVSQAYVRELAQQMITIQTAEADTLTKMIAERGGAPLPMN